MNQKHYLPIYTIEIPNITTKGDKPYIRNYISRMISEFVHDMSALENNPFTFPEVQTLLDGVDLGLCGIRTLRLF